MRLLNWRIDGMSDFVEDKPISLECDGKTFKIREPLGEEVDAILEGMYLIEEDENGKKITKVSLQFRNSAYLKLVVDAPYEKEGKKFTELDSVQRFELLSRLKPRIRGKLLSLIDKAIVKGSDVEKK